METIPSSTRHPGALPRDPGPEVSNINTGNSSRTDSAPRTRTAAKSWLVSLTVVCFLFGGLLAVQVGAMKTVRENRALSAAGLQEEKVKVQEMQRLAAKEEKARHALELQLKEAKAKLNKGTYLSAQQAKQLNMRIGELQLVAGLTPVSGPGVVIRLTDNPDAAKAGDASPFLPGFVHDFDLQQVVNELRAAKADAIAVNDRRITGYTPIRCVGPVIYINWEPVAAPFVVEAIGDSDTLMSALKMPNGIIDNLKNQTIGVHLSKADKLELPATEGLPRLQVAKPD